MTVIPPVAATQAGYASGGGIIDTIKNAITGGTTPSPAQGGAKGDGSVGLFDGVLGKALIGGGVGALAGFLPFIPGGPILGGIVGALGGAAMGVFGNFMKMQTIKKENEAQLAALGVQVNDPAVQEILKSGNVEQLLPLVQQQQAGGATTQTATQTGAQYGGTYTQAAATTPNIQTVTDPATGISQLIDVSTGTVVQQTGTTGATGATAAPLDPNANVGQSPLPTQGAVGGSGPAMTAAGIQEVPLTIGGGSAEVERLKVQLDQLQRQLDLVRELLKERTQAA
jgi:hypothetical protein